MMVAYIVLYIVKVLVMWSVVVTTEAEGPEPSVSVATVASTVVLMEADSPVEIVLVASAQSDQVSETPGVELATASTGELLLIVGVLVAASTGELAPELVVDSQSSQVSVDSELEEEVVSALTALLVVVVVDDEVVVIASTAVFKLLVVESQSAQSVHSLP